MSQRNVRKLFGGNTLPPPDDSEDEYVPLCAKTLAPRYQGLEISSNSESEHESEHESDHGVEANEALTEIKKKTKNNKKNKQRKQKNLAVRINSKEIAEMDEIDKSLMEVNALLGEPKPSLPARELPKRDPEKVLLECTAKHLNVDYELRRLFGPEENEEGGRRRKRQQQQQNLGYSLRKVVIVPLSPNANYQKIGLSMSIVRRGPDVTYYAFDHNRDYQRIHRKFLLNSNYIANLPIEEPSSRNLHVESLLESADSMFRIEEYTAANKLVEETIAYMQYVAHPSFNLTNGKTRLEYAYLENRPFHVAVLKYLYLLTNRACHRTALELAKLLLNLDPSDPLAVLFIIDTIALRAREHQWLIDAVLTWNMKRHGNWMFNLQYSFAMAHFHVARKTKGDMKVADYHLQNAMTLFPTVAMKITEKKGATSTTTRLQNHPLFTMKQHEMSRGSLIELIQLYAELTWSRWREPQVYEWLTRNMLELADKFDNDDDLREEAKVVADQNYQILRRWPSEIKRHLHVIRPMSQLLVEGAIPPGGMCRSSDPSPAPRGINRYEYETAPRAVPRTEAQIEGSIAAIFGILQSLYPGIALGPIIHHGEGEEAPNIPDMGPGAAALPLPAANAVDEELTSDDHDSSDVYHGEAQTVMDPGVSAGSDELTASARVSRETHNGTQIDPEEDEEAI